MVSGNDTDILVFMTANAAVQHKAVFNGCSIKCIANQDTDAYIAGDGSTVEDEVFHGAVIHLAKHADTVFC